MTPANELSAAFERLAMDALRAGTASAGGFSNLAAIVPLDHPASEAYEEALRLLRNIGRGLELQRGRGDADRVWEVTLESVSKLNVHRYLGLLSPAVVELLNAMCAEAKREAEMAARSKRN